MRGNDLPKERERKREKLIDRVKNSIQLFHSLPSDEQREERERERKKERKKERKRKDRLHALSLSFSPNDLLFKQSRTLHSSCAKIPLCVKFCVSGELHFKKTLFSSWPNTGAKSEAAMAANGRIVSPPLLIAKRFATDRASALDAIIVSFFIYNEEFPFVMIFLQLCSFGVHITRFSSHKKEKNTRNNNRIKKRENIV